MSFFFHLSLGLWIPLFAILPLGFLCFWIGSHRRCSGRLGVGCVWARGSRVKFWCWGLRSGNSARIPNLDLESRILNLRAQAVGCMTDLALVLLGLFLLVCLLLITWNRRRIPGLAAVECGLCSCWLPTGDRLRLCTRHASLLDRDAWEL